MDTVRCCSNIQKSQLNTKSFFRASSWYTYTYDNECTTSCRSSGLKPMLSCRMGQVIRVVVVGLEVTWQKKHALRSSNQLEWLQIFIQERHTCLFSTTYTDATDVSWSVQNIQQLLRYIPFLLGMGTTLLDQADKEQRSLLAPQKSFIEA